MGVNIGKMRHRVGIQTKTTARNAAGGLAETWTTSSTVWGSVEPLQGAERMLAQQVDSRVTHKIIMHYIDASTVTPANRLTYDSRTFEIHSVLNRGELEESVEIIASEDT